MRFWVSGALVEEDHASVSVLDHGFTVGDGVFETLKTVIGPDGGPVPFALDRHVARLSRSAVGLGLTEPEPGLVTAALLAVCAANPSLSDHGRLRVTLTSGRGPLGSDRSLGESTLVVTASPATRWPPHSRLTRSPWPRNEHSALAGLKTTSYAENAVALARAKAVGADEALLINVAGNVCEGTGSNVFAVIGGVVVTPPVSSGCLAGITRELVLEWCADAGLPTEERDLDPEALTAASEIFITSSTRDVHPVVEVLDVDGRPVWADRSGPVTGSVAAVFAARAGADWNP